MKKFKWSKCAPINKTVIQFDDVYDTSLFEEIYDYFDTAEFENLKHKRYNDTDGDLWLINSRIYMLILFTELKFNKEDVSTVLFCQELINSYDMDNILIAANILVKLKPIEK